MNLGVLRGFLDRADWLDRSRMRAYGSILLVLELAIFGTLVAAANGAFDIKFEPSAFDFASFYAAGHLANLGHPGAAYDWQQHYLTEQQILGITGFSYRHFFYPPIFIMICAVFARLPYLPAFAAFVAITLAAFAASFMRISRWQPRYLLLASFPPILFAAGTGQNSFLTGALFATATVLIDRRPLLAGVLLGCLAFKPHFGLLIPVALIAGGCWRGVLGAALAVAGLALLSVGLYGVSAWQDFIRASVVTQQTFENGRVDYRSLISAFAFVRLLGGGVVLAYGVQLLATAVAVTAVIVAWRRKVDLPIRAMILVSGTLIALPVILSYDLTLGVVALAWLFRDVQKTGWLRWEKIALVVLFILPILAFAIPMGPTVSLLLFGLCVRRLMHCLQATDRHLSTYGGAVG